MFSVHRTVKTGPSGPGVKLRIGREERLATGDTLIHALVMVIVEGSAKGSLRLLETADPILFWCEFLFPVAFWLISQVAHMFFLSHHSSDLHSSCKLSHILNGRQSPVSIFIARFH